MGAYDEHMTEAKRDSADFGRGLKICLLTAAQGGLCYYCGLPMSLALGLPITATIDHVIPKSKGGPNHMDNYVGACHDCNQKKGSMSVAAYMSKIAAGNVAATAAGLIIVMAMTGATMDVMMNGIGNAPSYDGPRVA